MRIHRSIALLPFILLLVVAASAGWWYLAGQGEDIAKNKPPISEIPYDRGASPEVPISPYAPDAPISSEEEGFEVVKVFYGTDRARADVRAQRIADRRSTCQWIWAFAAVTLVLILVNAVLQRKGRRPRLLRFLMKLGLGLSVVATGIGAYQTWEIAVIDPLGKRIYGGERGTLELGVCEVSIPTDRRVGTLRSPSILRFEVREDPRKHVILRDVVPLADDVFFNDLRKCVLKSKHRQAFVFVHGYRTPFEEAAKRAATLCYDLKFEGAPILYSWPSQGTYIAYTVDEANTVWTRPHLKEFLTAVAERSGADSINLIAHSMGNRVLTPALKELAYERENRPALFRNVVLTAPDIDAEVFRKEIAPKIVSTAEGVTLYASSNDKALKASKTVHGYPRAGESGPGLVVVPGIDTIDVSAVDTSLEGHTYFHTNKTVLADLFDLVQLAKRPEERRYLREMFRGRNKYWLFTLESSAPTQTSFPSPRLPHKQE